MQAFGNIVSKFGLWPRMALGISVGFMILFVAFTLLSERALRDSTVHTIEARQVIALMTASQIDALLGQALDTLRGAQEVPDFPQENLGRSEWNRVLAEIHERIGGSVALGVLLLDQEGQVLAAHPLDLAVTGPGRVDMSGLPPVFEAGNTLFTLRDFNDRPIIMVSTPVQSDGETKYLSALIDANADAILRPLREAAGIGNTGHALLTNERGSVLASTLRLPFLSPGEHALFYRRAISHGIPTVEEVPFELESVDDEPAGHTHLMAFAPLTNAPWGVAVGGDADETFAGVRNLRLGLALLGGVTLLSVWAATLIGTRRLVLPVRGLTTAAERIVIGDLYTPLQAPEGGEIGALATALERMRRQLLGNIEELSAWNETLETRVAVRTGELRQQEALARRLLRRSISVQEEERARLSLELHDELGQFLTAIQIGLDLCGRSLSADDPVTQHRLERVQSLTAQALTELRRMINALRPGVLDRLGLVPALEWVADHMLRPHDLTVDIDASDVSERLPEEIETILFRIAQETMNNIVRHSEASQVQIRLQRTDEQATMTVRDNGKGFDVAAITTEQEEDRGLGLAGMQERAARAGGGVHIDSEIGQGTAVVVMLPLPRSVDQVQTTPYAASEDGGA